MNLSPIYENIPPIPPTRGASLFVEKIKNNGMEPEALGKIERKISQLSRDCHFFWRNGVNSCFASRHNALESLRDLIRTHNNR